MEEERFEFDRGANIAALFPIIEVTLNGDSLQGWNARRIEQARERIEALKPKAQRQVRRWSENDARQLERERINATNAPAGKAKKKSP